MKKIISILLISFVFFAAKSKVEKPTPSCVNFSSNENLFIDDVEISNSNWAEYVAYNKHKFGETSETYVNSIPDTTVWHEAKAYQTHYFTHAAYKDYPVVGISYEQATAYCKWRSERVNIYYYVKKNKIKYNLDSSYADAPKMYEFRLPTPQELKTLSAVDYSEKTKIEIEKKHKNEPQHNLKKPNNPDRNKRVTDTDVTAPVKSYWPNAYGIYNIIGNVSELTNEKGIAYGGSWKDSYEDVKNNFEINYTKPTNYIGFRCVCEKKI